MQFSTKIDGFEQRDSQGFENSYNSYEQYPLEIFFIFTIYQNYTLALRPPHTTRLSGRTILRLTTSRVRADRCDWRMRTLLFAIANAWSRSTTNREDLKC